MKYKIISKVLTAIVLVGFCERSSAQGPVIVLPPGPASSLSLILAGSPDPSTYPSMLTNFNSANGTIVLDGTSTPVAATPATLPFPVTYNPATNSVSGAGLQPDVPDFVFFDPLSSTLFTYVPTDFTDGNGDYFQSGFYAIQVEVGKRRFCSRQSSFGKHDQSPVN